MDRYDWLLFSYLSAQQRSPYTEGDVQRLLRETLNAPSPYKYVIDPAGIDDVVTTITYSGDDNSHPVSCPITMEDFSKGEMVSKLECGHIFKPDAISNWLLTEKAECPVCRHKLPCMEVRNQDEQSFQEELLHQSRHHADTNERVHEREDNNNNVIAFLSSLQALQNINQH